MSDRLDIAPSTVRALIADQHPQWADLPVEPVIPGGWNNRTFRLGDALSVRMPTARRYAAQVEKEHAWLPRLAPALPLPVPAPLALGEPGHGYPFRWSVNHWLPGEVADLDRIDDPARFGADLARFLRALQRIDAAGGPPAGRHSFFRGGGLATYDEETRGAIALLEGRVGGARALTIWEEALASAWGRAPVWVHGDFAQGNLLVENGRLNAVIDFGLLNVGDPACDLAIAWTLLDEEGRAAFRAGLAPDAGTWARGRGWVLWKALIVAAGWPGTDPEKRPEAERTLRVVMAD